MRMAKVSKAEMSAGIAAKPKKPAAPPSAAARPIWKV
jgi:hypothetical protein